MTLVYRSPKGQVLKPVNELGPGSYNLTANNKKPKENFQKSSVFASTTKRDPFEIKKQEKKGKQIKKFSEKEMKSQQQKAQANSKSVTVPNPQIIKNYPDCQHVFNSKVQRFPPDSNDKQRERNSKEAMLVEEFKKILLKDINKVQKGKLIKTKDKVEKQNELRGKSYQLFPSIPNLEYSFGYHYDSSLGQWVQNQNPNLMRRLLQNQIQSSKDNYALGPGYYVPKNKDRDNHSSIEFNKKQNKPQPFAQTMIYPNLETSYPAHHTIEEDQLKLKTKIRLLGKSTLKTMQDKLSIMENLPNSQLFDFEKNKRENLIMSQMIKKFGEFIPEHQKSSPANYIEKLKEKKQQELKEKLCPNNTISKDSDLPSHFLSKSYRFPSIKDSQLDITSQIPEPESKSNQDTVDNSTMIIKSHNRKQPFLLGEERFKNDTKIDLIGPGAYSNQNFLERNKSSPCLNLKQKRFDSEIGKNDIPGPGDYDVTQNILKKQNNLGNAYSYYKEIQKQEIKRNLKQQETMEALYQNWGRQMNYIAKMDQSLKPQQSYMSLQGSKGQNEEKSFIKIRKQLQTSINRFQSSPPEIMKQKQQTQSKIEKTSKVYPKLTKHLYEYKQPHDDKKTQNMGPGKYQTRRQMIKKTFNVTYT